MASIPTEISIPVLHKLTYVSNLELSTAFIILLTNAASIDTSHLAHPAFIPILDRLSQDEVKILYYLRNKLHIPRLSVNSNYANERSSIDTRMSVMIAMTGLEKNVEMTFPQNVSIYIDNLLSLDLLNENFNMNLVNMKQETFATVELQYKAILDEFLKMHSVQTSAPYMFDDGIINKHRSFYRVSDYGRLFIEACIMPASN